jgi:DNA-binding response OmpR family regulator
MKILIIEDEPGLQEVMMHSLQRENYQVETADTFHAAMDKALVYDYDCIILDIMLPGGTGLDILKELKAAGKNDSVIIVSAKDSLDDKVAGLDLGADDYLAKPFHTAELNARVKSILRRKNFSGSPVIEAGNLSIDTENRTVTINGENVPLNRKEYDILLYFVMNRNRLVNKTSLAEHVWGDHADEADSYEFIYSQIKNLRKKLKDHNATAEIQAVYGIGYKLLVP